MSNEGNYSLNDFLINKFRVYHERVYMDNVVSNIWFVRSFSSQRHSNLIPNIATEKVSQNRTKNARPDPSFAKYISTFCVPRDTLTVIQLYLLLCLS